MKRLTLGILVLLSLLANPLAGAGKGPDLWSQGQSLYAAGDFEAALSRFQELQKQSDHWRIHANIGNCFYKLERLLEAKAAWIRAWSRRPGHPALVKNLKVVNQRLGVDDLLLRQSLWQKAAAALGRMVSLPTGALLLILFLFLFNGALFFWMRGRWVRPARYAVLLSFLMISLLGIHQELARRQLQRQDLTVIKAENVSLYSGPGDHHTPLFSLPRGLTVEIRERGERWLRVTAGNEVAGWVRPEWLMSR